MKAKNRKDLAIPELKTADSARDDAALFALLQLSPEQAQALALIVEWEGVSVVEFMRLGLDSLMEMSLSDMEEASESRGLDRFNGPASQVRVRAKTFLKRVQPLMEKAGAR